MTNRQKLEIRRSEVRSRLAEIAGLDELTDEIRSESKALEAQFSDLEVQYRAAVISEQEKETRKAVEPDAEQKALNRLLERANVGTKILSVVEGRSVRGAEKEVDQHFKIEGDGLAIDYLRETSRELRAVTPGPADVGAVQRPIIGEIFPDGVASFLGVSMPTVAVGEQTYTVLTTGADVKTPAENAAAAETTGAFTATVLAPKRAQASFFWSIEDEARLAGMESALRQNLRQALSSKFDRILIHDSGAGLLGGGLTAPNDPTAVATFAGYKSAVTSQVDGLYASMPDQVRLLIGSDTYGHAEGLYRTNNQGNNESAFEIMSRKSGGVRVSSHVPAKASDIQGAIAARRINAMHAVFPTWRRLTVIPDRVTKAANGQVLVTVVALWALKVLRADGFQALKFKLA